MTNYIRYKLRFQHPTKVMHPNIACTYLFICIFHEITFGIPSEWAIKNRPDSTGTQTWQWIPQKYRRNNIIPYANNSQPKQIPLRILFVPTRYWARSLIGTNEVQSLTTLLLTKENNCCTSKAPGTDLFCTELYVCVICIPASTLLQWKQFWAPYNTCSQSNEGMMKTKCPALVLFLYFPKSLPVHSNGNELLVHD